MILVFGGAAETGEIVTTLMEAGLRVMVSTLTDFPLEAPLPRTVLRRSGPLDAEGIRAIAAMSGIVGIVDVTHPYSVEASGQARRAADASGLPYWRYARPPAIDSDAKVIRCATHEEAAKAACSLGKPVLLTTGSRNLRPYMHEAMRCGMALTVRVLPTDDSVKACLEAGVPQENIITGVGPFSVEDNLAVIRSRSIGALVTKDGGAAGGVREKLEAARVTGCRVVVVTRPRESADRVFTDVGELRDAVVGFGLTRA